MTNLTPEILATLRRRAEQEQVLFNPKEVLALLDRIEALEKDKDYALTGLREAHATLKRVNAGLKRLRALEGAV